MNKDDIAQLKQKVYDSDVLYQWEYIGHSAGKRVGPRFQWIMAFFPPIVFSLFLYFVTDNMTFFETGTYVLLTLDLIWILSIRYLFVPDEHYQYSLTQYGIHYTSQDVIPEAAYAAVRGFAWFGIAVCIVAVFVIGPMAFVGVGAMALLSFGLTNFSSKIKHRTAPFYERNVIFDYKNDNFFEIWAYDAPEDEFCRRIFASSTETKSDMIDKLNYLLPNLEVLQIDKLKDKFKHPLYNKNT